MKSKILEVVINLVRNQAVAMVLCFLTWMEASCTAPTNRLWTDFGANMALVFGGNFTEVTATSLFFCAAIASANPPANLACYVSSRCVFASVYLPYIGGKQTEGFKCWYSNDCRYEGPLVDEKEIVPDFLCPETETHLLEGKKGCPGLPPNRTTCTAPFTQHSFGCMYDSNFTGTYCEARRYCQEMGTNLASPETEQDTVDMCSYYDNAHSVREHYYVGLFFVNGEWRWPANQREASGASTGEWAFRQPDGGENATVMYPWGDMMYKIGDTPMNEKHKALCHAWNVY